MTRSAHPSVLAFLSRALGIAVLAGLMFAGAPRAELPGEVTGLTWCPGSTDCLEWSSTPGATTFDVHRGAVPDLPGLLDSSPESCAVGSFDLPTTGAGLDGDPLAGAAVWYLVTARNAEGSGGAGDGSAGPRSLDSSGACTAGFDLVLNEVDYDQPGTDFGEFIEIYNGRPAARDLAGLALILVNGGTGEEYRRYNLGDAAASLPAGAYLVVGAPSIIAALPPGTPSIQFGSSSNSVQNGAPDGVALFDTTTGELLDALSYEGSITAAQFAGQSGSYNLVEGTATTIEDSNSGGGSLSRSPDGSDTDDAATDWQFVMVTTPGNPNAAP